MRQYWGRAKLRAWHKRENYDPTPWCHACGARTAKRCTCGPIDQMD